MDNDSGKRHSGPPPATLKFDVVPDRAWVFVDDSYVGRVSDFEEKTYPLSPQEHRIKIELHGYETFEEIGTLIPAQKFELKARLPRLSDKAKIAIQSVLDRVIDREPKRRVESVPTPARSVRAVKEALRRDLELLMNTRRVDRELSESFKELRSSVYLYGLSDITSMKLVTPADQQLLLRELEVSLALFEPRISRAKVRVRMSDDSPHLVPFAIEGLLRVDPEPIPVR